jgi:hypothetical protein
MKTSNGVVIVDRYVGTWHQALQGESGSLGEGASTVLMLVEELSRVEAPITPEEYIRAACAVMMDEDSSKNEKVPEYPDPSDVCAELIKRRVEGDLH